MPLHPNSGKGPYYGVLGPNETLRYAGREGPGERPLVWGRDDAIQLDVKTHEILVRNVSSKPAFYLFAIVPAPVATAAIIPWRRVIAAWKMPGGPARILDGILQQASKRLLP